MATTNDTITILGLDPGTATTGYGIIGWDGRHASLVDFGTITTPKDSSDAQRLRVVRENLITLVEDYRPDRAAVEKIFFTKNVKTAIVVAQARGVLLEAAASTDIRIAEFAPNEVKMALTGYGNAEKQQVQYMVQQILDLQEIPTPDDAADALAVAVCCAHTL